MNTKKFFLSFVLSITLLVNIISTSVSFANSVDTSESYNFRNIGINEGLSQTSIEALFQDKKGYIWIGTNDGLNRYNGYQFEYYIYDEYNENSISNNYITDIMEDNNNYIWVSTTNGLNRINTVNNTISKYSSDKNNGNLSNNNILAILFTHNKKLFAGSFNGLNLYNKESNSFERVLEKDVLPSQCIYSITEDSSNNIWIGTDKGAVKFDSNLNKIKDFSDELNNSQIYRIYDDYKGNIWISTIGEGLFKIEYDNNYKIIQYNKDNKLADVVRDTQLDDKGNLWVATDNGLYKFDYSTNSFFNYKSMPYDENSLVNNNCFRLIKDVSGLIWIGTYNGLSFFNPSSNFHILKAKWGTNSSGSNSIHGIYKDDNFLWLGTNIGGLKVLNLNTKETSFFNTNNSSLADNAIHDITGYDNKVYIATNNGISVVDTKYGDINNYTEYYSVKDGLPDNKIRCVHLDKDKNLWIGTTRGLAFLNTETKKIENLNYLLEEAGIPNAFIKAIYQDSNGEFYIGGFSEEGLVKYNPVTKSIKLYTHDNSKNSINNDSIRYITEDSNNNLFIGTSYGLSILDKDRISFTNYTDRDGLANNTVYCVLLDDDENAWLSTNYGLSKFNTSDKIFENFTVSDGIQSNEFNGQSAFKDADGLLYFGGSSGVNIFNPKEIKTSLFIPTVSFDKFKVKGLSTPILKDNKFKYSDNNIEISYFLNDYKNTRAVKYYYKLDGLDTDWNLITNNSILFASLNPGDYTFRIKARNYNGLFTKENKLNFKIQPPFWRTKTALLIYLLIILTFIYLNVSKVKRLDKLVYSRTKELHQEIDKNKELYEKVIELEINKNNYFVNLSHELRTPLNVLNAMSEVFKTSARNKNSIPIDKLINYSDIIERNSKRLLNLINNLIDNSKLQNNSYILNKKYQNIVYIVEEAVLSMKDFIEEKGIELIIDTDVEEKYISCDKLEIEKCIVNIVNNAVKHTDSGGSIEVFIYDLNDKVKISIKDTGVGISEENQKYIFDRFNQVIDKDSEIKGGSGLGLTIVKQLVELHGGSISVKSELGVGSEFIIVLPQD